MQQRGSRAKGVGSAAGLGLLGVCLAAMLGAGGILPAARAEVGRAPAVDYDRDIRPILADNCFACHGFDPKQRQAGLRLDVPEGAFAALKSGKHAVVPRNPGASEMVRRILLKDGLKMPPAASGKQLKPEQVAVLRRWVEQGAPYSQHWAFVAPKRPAVPRVQPSAWVRNPIDAFVLARLQREKLPPSPEADRRTLARRLSLDLRGLPPTLREVEQFVADRRPDAYERLVDRFLASPHYGERMALKWLDLARYADTHGYHIDSHRDMWLWRDWVIDAFNRNLSFDRFTIEQLAGDLLPNPTLEQRIATGFNRNHPINFEGGAIPEEYQAAYIFDRIDTTATTWLALTMRCGQCHDHKYDPFTQKEFYRFYAFFHNVPEQGLDGQRGNARPFLKVASTEQQAKLAEYAERIRSLDADLKAAAARQAGNLAAWEQEAGSGLDRMPPITAGLTAYFPLDEAEGADIREEAGRQQGARIRGDVLRDAGKFGGAVKLDGRNYVDLGNIAAFDRTDSFSYGAWVRPAGREAMTVLSKMDDGAGFRGWDLYLQDGKVYAHLIHDWEKDAIRVNTKAQIPLNEWTHVFASYDGSSKAVGVRLFVNGVPVELERTHDRLTSTFRTERPVLVGRRNPAAPFRGLVDDVRIYGREVAPEEVRQLAGPDGTIRRILQTEAGKRSPADTEALRRYLLETRDEEYRTKGPELVATRQRQAEMEAAIPTVMVMEELPKPRETHVLVRGQYDKKGEVVTAGYPSALAGGSDSASSDRQPSRLDLARWLVSPNHPLTARVAVNRFWEQYFGLGLVRTAENFGTQGERPSHPELLDWLATEFIRTGWDMKAFQKLIVTSATYRQVSRLRPDLQQRDPENRLLARGPRSRLPAELIRDQALAVSGLLAPKIGGPSVKPYHPAGVWEELAFGGNFTAQTYVQDHGEALYRRSLYTFWKRTCPPPSLTTFDAPDREFCMVRRLTTNTPLQALVLMNDPTYVEAARKLAERLLTEVAATPEDRIRYAYRLLLARTATNTEVQVLRDIYRAQLERYRKDPEAAGKLTSVGESPRNERLDVAEHAAWSSVAGVLLNLDEVITKN